MWFSKLKRNETEPFLKSLITGDEKRITYDKNVRKKSWSKSEQTPQTIAKPGLTCNKLMLRVWWNWKDIIHHDVLPPGKTINLDLYCQQLMRFKHEVEKIHPGSINRKGTKRCKVLPIVLAALALTVLFDWRKLASDTSAVLQPPEAIASTDLHYLRRNRKLLSYIDHGTEPLIEPSSATCEAEEGSGTISLVALVTSAPHRVLNREAIRTTWGQHIPTYFFLGLPSDGIDEMLVDYYVEAKQHGDIVVGDFVDAYHNLTLKTMFMVQWARRRCAHAKYLFKTDDDVLVNPWTMEKVLRDNYEAALIGCVRPLSLFYSDASVDGVEEIARSALSLARSAQAERDNESCFFRRPVWRARRAASAAGAVWSRGARVDAGARGGSCVGCNRVFDFSGYVKNDSAPHRDVYSKWHLPRWLYPRDLIPQYLSGTGYLIKGNRGGQTLRTRDPPAFRARDGYTKFSVVLQYGKLKFRGQLRTTTELAIGLQVMVQVSLISAEIDKAVQGVERPNVNCFYRYARLRHGTAVWSLITVTGAIDCYGHGAHTAGVGGSATEPGRVVGVMIPWTGCIVIESEPVSVEIRMRDLHRLEGWGRPRQDLTFNALRMARAGCGTVRGRAAPSRRQRPPAPASGDVLSTTRRPGR
ncbi:Beta-1,3-galactosyltransferase 5 [Eumeta japonica]|uniref:Beta-1,3-galactosyltransferase 5 n=1 Tax=Eumeta variegata TaxID=151549 RepID=A0A4C1ZLX3_EUMVA|nr:Beta-1,3-galactosyltransferase 5 [Eumeta japonica]